MWRALVAALVVSAARGEEYAGGAMPQYAEYERSEARPPARDYSYDDPTGEADKSVKYGKEVDRWRKPGRAAQRRGASYDAGEEWEAPARIVAEPARPKPRVRARRERLRDPHLSSEAPRRKPRERMFAPPPPPRHDFSKVAEFAADEGELEPNRRTKEDKLVDPEYWSGEERDRDPGTVRPDSGAESDSETAHNEKGRLKPALYQEYDYYTMKKQDNLKIKLPMLQRRTTTMARMWVTTYASASSSAARPMWGGRRLNVDSSEAAAPPAELPVAAGTVAVSVAESAAPLPAPVNITALSLAERSKLSILRKSKMKEAVKGAATKKPPVLLLARSRAPTVVMVETADPWMRAREVSGDAPETLDKVKRLMRQKLVANAKNIRDLTDNWDDTVCDYIDVSMLNDRNLASPLARLRLLIVLSITCLLDSTGLCCPSAFTG